MEEALNYFKKDDLATEAWESKYALRDNNNIPLEFTPDDMHKRMAKQFARIENNYNKGLLATNKSNYLKSHSLLSEYGKHIQCMSEGEIYELFKDFKYVIPGGSVMSMLGNPYQIGSLSNCFVIGQPEDSYAGIQNKRTEQVQLMKRRGGVGKDLSLLRPKGAFVNNAAKTSTGPVSFMNVDSELTREVAQDGRRGALMLSIDIKHPDSGDFILSKQQKDVITGANISVKLGDNFMNAVKNNHNYLQGFPIDNNVIIDTEIIFNKLYSGIKGDNERFWFKKIHSKELWDSLIHCAWNTAEPGILFSDRHYNYSPDGVYPEFKGITTNPCGEIFMQPYDSCRLIHINLTSFVINPFTKEAYIDFDKLYEVAYKTMRLADDLIDLEIESIDKILEHISSKDENNADEIGLWAKIRSSAVRGRRAGVGFTGLADMLAMVGMDYGSNTSLITIEAVMDSKMRGEYDATVDMAVTRGSFKGYKLENEFTYSQGISADGFIANNEFYEFLMDKYPEITERMIQFGRRNISWSTVAPTGTVSLMAQTSSGIEPIYLPYYMRKKKCSNPNDRVDITDATGEKFTEYYVIHPMFKAWMIGKFSINVEPELLSQELLDHYFKSSPWANSQADMIGWQKRIDLQAIIQKYTTHSISSTINLPEDISENVISDIYMEAWEKGLKGITVYRDKCRDGILNSVNETVKTELEIIQHRAPKRPKVLPAELHVVKSKGITYAVIVGFLGDKPFEIFAYELKSSLGISFIKPTAGTITKVKKGDYKFESENYIYNHLVLANDKIEERAATLYASMLLRTGADINYIIKTARKVNDNIVSFSSAMCRVLDKYIPKAIVEGELCPNCGSPLIHEAGCTKCLNCSYSKCFMVHQNKRRR